MKIIDTIMDEEGFGQGKTVPLKRRDLCWWMNVKSPD